MTFDTDKYTQMDADGGLPIVTRYNIRWQTYDWWWNMFNPVGYNDKITININRWWQNITHKDMWLQQWWQMVIDSNRIMTDDDRWIIFM